MITSINLYGGTQWNVKFPPRDAKKGYVARITGRAQGAVKYQREFLGSDVTLVAGDEGLYEVQTGERKGGYTRRHQVVLSHPDHGLILSVGCDDATVARVAAELDKGRSIAEVVEVQELRPSEKYEGLMIFDAGIRTAAQAAKAAASATVEAALEACWTAISELPQPQQRKVLAELRKRLTQQPDQADATPEQTA